MADLNASMARLNAAIRMLEQRRQATNAVWSDQVSRRIDEEHLIPLLAQTEATLRDLERLSQVVAQARQRVH